MVNMVGESLERSDYSDDMNSGNTFIIHYIISLETYYILYLQNLY